MGSNGEPIRVKEVEELYGQGNVFKTEPTTRYCPLTIHMGEPSCCIKEHCAWFVRNGCAIFHIACAAIEWEKVLRSRGGNE